MCLERWGRGGGFNEVKGGYGGGYGGRKNFIDSMFVILSSNIIHFFSEWTMIVVLFWDILFGERTFCFEG